MRNLGAVDSELAVLSGVRRVMKADGIDPGQDVVDRLLDERLELMGGQ